MEKSKMNFYDFIIMLYIVAIYVFENHTYSLLFSLIQIIFLVSTIFVVITRKKIVSNIFIFFQLSVLLLALVIELSISSYSLGEIYIFLGNIIKIGFLIQYFITEERINKTILFMVIGGVAASSITLFEFFSRGITEYDLRYASNERLGADISGGNVNITALNLCFAFSGAIYFFFKEKFGSYKKGLFFSIVCLIFSALIFTGSRKILLFCLVVCLIQTYFKSKKNFIWATFIVILIYICFINIELLYFYIGHKIDIFGKENTTEIYNNSDAIREKLILDGFQLFFNNIFGVGLGGVSREIGIYAHNNYVEILASMGIVGFLLYYSVYLYPLIILRKVVISKELLVFFVSSILGLLVIEWYQVTYLYKIPMIFLALSASCVTLKKGKKKGKGKIHE